MRFTEVKLGVVRAALPADVVAAMNHLCTELDTDPATVLAILKLIKKHMKK